MKQKPPTKMDIMREEAINELLKSFLPLLKGEFQEVRQKLLHEVLIGKKSRKELSESLPHFPAMLYERNFRSGVARLCKIPAELMEIAAEHKKVKDELEDLRKKFAVVETKRNNRAKLTPEQQEVLALTLEQAGFSARIRNSFEGPGIETIADLVTFSRKDILKFRNTGQKSVDEVETFLKSNGLTWEMQV